MKIWQTWRKLLRKRCCRHLTLLWPYPIRIKWEAVGYTEKFNNSFLYRTDGQPGSNENEPEKRYCFVDRELTWVNTLAVAPSTCDELLCFFCMAALCSTAGVMEQFSSSVFSSKDSESIHRPWSLNNLLFELITNHFQTFFLHLRFSHNKNACIIYLHSVLRLI